MKHLDDIIASYDASETSDARKIQILRWFRRHPDQRLDRMELHSELDAELDIGPRQLKQYLDELVEEGVLAIHGEQRQAYYLADDIRPPAKYEVKAALTYLLGIVDYQRWGLAGIAAMTTTLWAVLTGSIWVLWVGLVISPLQTSYGPVSQAELLVLGIAMAVWLVVFLLITLVVYRLYRYRSTVSIDHPTQ